MYSVGLRHRIEFVKQPWRDPQGQQRKGDFVAAQHAIGPAQPFLRLLIPAGIKRLLAQIEVESCLFAANRVVQASPVRRIQVEGLGQLSINL